MRKLIYFLISICMFTKQRPKLTKTCGRAPKHKHRRTAFFVADHRPLTLTPSIRLCYTIIVKLKNNKVIGNFLFAFPVPELTCTWFLQHLILGLGKPINITLTQHRRKDTTVAAQLFNFHIYTTFLSYPSEQLRS